MSTTTEFLNKQILELREQRAALTAENAALDVALAGEIAENARLREAMTDLLLQTLDQGAPAHVAETEKPRHVGNDVSHKSKNDDISASPALASKLSDSERTGEESADV